MSKYTGEQDLSRDGLRVLLDSVQRGDDTAVTLIIEEWDRLHKALEHGVYVNVADLGLLLAECRVLATHVVEFPYHHNEDGCLEYSRKIKVAAEQLRAKLDELQ